MVAPVVVSIGKALAWGLPTVFGALDFGIDIYSTAKNVEYNSNVNNETDAYWADYEKNTGVVPLYPYRAGYYNSYLGSALDATQAVVGLYKRHGRKYGH